MVSGTYFGRMKLVPGAFGVQEHEIPVSQSVRTSSVAEATLPANTPVEIATVKPSPVPVTVAVSSSPVKRKHPEREKWSQFLNTDEDIITAGLVVKPSKIGLSHQRQLILTTTPRLIYVDPKKMELKGEVEWTKDDPPTIYALNKDTFEIAVSSRTYKFVDKTNLASYWINIVQDTVKNYC